MGEDGYVVNGENATVNVADHTGIAVFVVYSEVAVGLVSFNVEAQLYNADVRFTA